MKKRWIGLVVLGLIGGMLSPINAGSWKDLRDMEVVKQQYDFSCGPASLATILNFHYGIPISEAEILQIINTGQPATFADLAYVAEQLKFKAMGIAANMEHLKNLKIPAIVHLNNRGMDHFSVVRGVDDDVVWLADPSWGNRKMKHHEFLEMWKTRDDEKLYGKLLLILPGEHQPPASQYFQSPQTDHTVLSRIKERRFMPPSHGHASVIKRDLYPGDPNY